MKITDPVRARQIVLMQTRGTEARHLQGWLSMWVRENKPDVLIYDCYAMRVCTVPLEIALDVVSAELETHDVPETT